LEKKNIWKHAAESLANKGLGYAAEKVCGAVADKVKADINNQTAEKLDLKLQDFDFTGFSKLGDNCDLGGQGTVDQCASNIVGSLSTFDPTGVMGVANAFIKPYCKKLIEFQGDESVVDVNNSIQVWKDCRYTGDSLKLNESKTTLIDWNDYISSIKVGSGVTAIIFSETDFAGKFKIIKSGEEVSCLDDEKFLVKSILIRDDDISKCTLLTTNFSDRKSPTTLICNSDHEFDLDKNFPLTDTPLTVTQIYEDKKLTGKLLPRGKIGDSLHPRYEKAFEGTTNFTHDDLKLWWGHTTNTTTKNTKVLNFKLKFSIE